jgi:DNA polymerase-3 subunit delta
MDSLAFLERGPRGTPLPVYVLHGDEDFLKRRVLAALRRFVLGDDPDGMGVVSHAGDRATYAAVIEDLTTLPFLARRRLVVIDRADPFVTLHRAALEAYVAKPSATGVLVLDVTTWPSNTRLAKALTGNATVVCNTPKVPRLADWCVGWAADQHGKTLTADAARLLVDLVGPEMGQLDQELAKLAAYAGGHARIDAQAVDRLVGNSREENIWKIFEAIGSGQPGAALTILARLFDQGEAPMRLLGAFSMQLRRLAQAATLNAQGKSLSAALELAGVPPYAVKGCEQQLRHLGRRRADRIYDLLLETDLGLKGSSQLPERTVLERLVVRLARPLQPA